MVQSKYIFILECVGAPSHQQHSPLAAGEAHTTLELLAGMHAWGWAQPERAQGLWQRASYWDLERRGNGTCHCTADTAISRIMTLCSCDTA